MNRRRFLTRIVALPFVGSLVGRLFGVTPTIQIRVDGHSEECGYYQLAKLRAFQTQGLKRGDGADPMDAAMRRLEKFYADYHAMQRLDKAAVPGGPRFY